MSKKKSLAERFRDVDGVIIEDGRARAKMAKNAKAGRVEDEASK